MTKNRLTSRGKQCLSPAIYVLSLSCPFRFGDLKGGGGGGGGVTSVLQETLTLTHTGGPPPPPSVSVYWFSTIIALFMGRPKEYRTFTSVQAGISQAEGRQVKVCLKMGG